MGYQGAQNSAEWDQPLNNNKIVPREILELIGWSEYVENLKRPYPKHDDQQLKQKSETTS